MDMTEDKIIGTETAHSMAKLIERNIRSTSNGSLQFQFEKQCKGDQPCTCYYPDHPNVAIFQLGTDETTANASGINGTGPGNCEDLERLGYSLEGFYMVRFNSKRVKTIYCKFNQNITTKRVRISRALEDKKTMLQPKTLKKCGGFGNTSCSFYYPDYPDIKSTIVNKNLINGDDSNEGPTSCENLKNIGYKLAGFYMVRIDTMKLKTLYCDFRHEKNEITEREWTLEKKNVSSPSKAVYKFCNGLGSQPCSCYFTNVKDILQFELSSDETTRSASKANGTGPASCQDLEKLGYRLNGFYLVRFKEGIIKTIFCKLRTNLPVIDEEEIKSTERTTATSTKKAKKPKVRHSTMNLQIKDEEEKSTETTTATSTKTTTKTRVRHSTISTTGKKLTCFSKLMISKSNAAHGHRSN